MYHHAILDDYPKRLPEPTSTSSDAWKMTFMTYVKQLHILVMIRNGKTLSARHHLLTSTGDRIMLPWDCPGKQIDCSE